MKYLNEDVLVEHLAKARHLPESKARAIMDGLLENLNEQTQQIVAANGKEN